MAVTDRYIIWDFDGTLGYRDGMWSGALLEVLQANGVGAGVAAADLKPYLRDRFRWHQPEVQYRAGASGASGGSSDEWWDELDPVFECAFAEGARVGREKARRLAREVRRHYANPARWHVYPDVVDTLSSLTKKGWRHVLLTNHVPELPGLLRLLDMERHIERVFNSAETGFEKPHRQAFENVKRALPAGATLWMVGDNPVADVEGAEAAGIPAILVRKASPAAKRFAEGLAGVEGMLERAD